MIVMKKSIYLFTVSLLIVSCSSRKSEPITNKTFDNKSERLANGERVYMMRCQKCHPGGEAGVGPALNSNPAPSFVKRFQVRHGLGVMPSFSTKEISRDDLHDVTAFLKTWKKQ
jgi:mono/diheme cytochrome c family protein